MPNKTEVLFFALLVAEDAIRRDRALWYESITGQPLTGTLTERWEKADVLARSFRVDNTRSGRP